MGGEWRGVAVIGRIEPKPIAPPPKDDAPVIIVVASHGVALPELPVVIVNRKSHDGSPRNSLHLAVIAGFMVEPMISHALRTLFRSLPFASVDLQSSRLQCRQ